MIQKIIKLNYRILKTIYQVEKKLKLNNCNADYIIWMPFWYKKQFLLSDDYVKILALYNALAKRKYNVTIYTKKNIGRFYNKKIFIIGTKMFNIYNFFDYTSILHLIVEELEKQDNTVFPNSYQIKFWENKDFMHKEFERLSINTPKTKIIYSLEELKTYNFTYPFLLKEIHSCSANGIYKINSWDDLVRYENINFKEGILVQELLNIKRDLRVILIGNEIVLHYWRINLSNEWKPTSTGYGSMVDFETFPEQWRKWIIKQFSKLNLDTGAFDIAWQNDDLKTTPYILEVSPFYQPNPKPPKKLLIPYGEWKKSFSLINNYDKSFIELVFDIYDKYIDYILNCKRYL